MTWLWLLGLGLGSGLWLLSLTLELGFREISRGNPDVGSIISTRTRRPLWRMSSNIEDIHQATRFAGQFGRTAWTEEVDGRRCGAQNHLDFSGCKEARAAGLTPTTAQRSTFWNRSDLVLHFPSTPGHPSSNWIDREVTRVVLVVQVWLHALMKSEHGVVEHLKKKGFQDASEALS